jgi:formylglycine-generating enzyme required for sulfatase activity
MRPPPPIKPKVLPKTAAVARRARGFQMKVLYWSPRRKPPDVHVSKWWGRGQLPAINVSWHDAHTYAEWLSRITGKDYRLLSEAEYEYAARAGSQTKFPWGDDIKLDGKAMANRKGCGSQWDGVQTAPVGSLPANRFGLYDMLGNLAEWTEDCWHQNYEGAPADGSVWPGGDCGVMVLHGGSWRYDPDALRSASRDWFDNVGRAGDIGFRVARTLSP